MFDVEPASWNCVQCDMSRAQKLKVYRTPIGFHDAYVAAPSQKAALEAWGTEANLFAQGLAEQITDPALSAEPLSSPGQVIRKLRGSKGEQVAALGKKAAKETRARTTLPKPLGPKPSSMALSDAEEAFSAVQARQQEELEEVKHELVELERKRRALGDAHEAELEKAEARCLGERQAYEKAIRQWRQSVKLMLGLTDFNSDVAKVRVSAFDPKRTLTNAGPSRTQHG